MYDTMYDTKTALRIGALLVIGFGTVLHREISTAQAQVGNIIGEIRITDVGLPDRQILVNLQARGATINSAYAETDGRFGFYALPDGVYSIVIEDENYARVDQQVILNLAISTTAFARITLTKISKEKNSNSSRVNGANPDIVDQSDFVRKFPKNAVKEYEKGLRARVHDPNGAVSHFHKAVEIAPEFYQAHNELGRIYLSRSEFCKAEQEFSTAVHLNQSDSQGHLNLANVYLLTKEYGKASSEVNDGLRKDPNSAFGYFVLGSIYERTGKTGDAESALRRALDRDPSMSKVHLELVNLYLGEGKKAEAISELQVFLHNFPKDPFAPKARDVMNRLNSATSR
jgi:tetratricopeptide (TPR) repeat protein